MVKILLKIKHSFPFIWNFIEWFNGFLFKILFSKSLNKLSKNTFSEIQHDVFNFREIGLIDLEGLVDFFKDQTKEDLEYFKPHKFDKKTLNKLLRNPSFLMMGAFVENKIVGYFFLRFFVNKNAFIGRIVGRDYRRKGMAKVMSKLLYTITWNLGFRCLTTISKSNTAIVDLHKLENSIKILKELPNDYMMVEILKSDTKF